jgi:hypothetical protein
MSDPTYTAPAMPPAAPGEVWTRDPVAVAVGNASLLGVGYLLLRRYWFALAAVAGTVVLVSRLVSTSDASYEVAVLVWWAAVIVHGWFLARRSAGGGRTVRSQRLVALAVTMPVLLILGLLRFDATRIQGGVADARRDGDCARVAGAQDQVWFGHRVADAPGTARGDEVVAACDRLRTATAQLSKGLTGDTRALRKGFGTLAAVLAKDGNDKTVEATLNRFLGRLPVKDPCVTADVAGWLRSREPSHDLLDRSADTAARTAPAALVGCADDFMAHNSWEPARDRYDVLQWYPRSDLADRARKGTKKAALNIELTQVSRLLTAEADEQPAYCSSPAKYSGAKPMGKGTNRALFFAHDEYSIASDYAEKLPGSWKADGAADAVLVVCMGEVAYGPSTATCPYRSQSSGAVSNVTFHKIVVPVKVYELRTGKLVTSRKLQIGGTSCPSTVYAEEGSDPGPLYVRASASDVRAAFRPLVVR